MTAAELVKPNSEIKKTRIKDELEQVRGCNGDELLVPEEVVAYAHEHEESELHKCFTWDDSEAARQHRLWQARQVIRVSVEVIEHYNEPVRAYVSLSSDREGAGGGYRTIRSVLSDAERRPQLLKDALIEMRTFKRKYRLLSELSNVFKAMEETTLAHGA